LSPQRSADRDYFLQAVDFRANLDRRDYFGIDEIHTGDFTSPVNGVNPVLERRKVDNHDIPLAVKTD